MRLLLTGSSGFVGRALRAFLERRGDVVVGLERGEMAVAKLEGFDAVIHLAGEPVFGRWTPAKKQRILESRVQSTLQICGRISQLPRPPKTFISASAIGYYGDRGEELLTEESRCGTGFLPEVCTAWENASRVLESQGVRRVHTRFGVVIGRGGILQKMLLPYKLGLGGKLGSGQQWMSWVALDDVVGAIVLALDTPTLRGPINVVAPQAVRQHQWAEMLARLLHRPYFVHTPAWLLRLALGQMADELLLTSQHAVPAKLRSLNFVFQEPSLEKALRKALI